MSLPVKLTRAQRNAARRLAVYRDSGNQDYTQSVYGCTLIHMHDMVIQDALSVADAVIDAMRAEQAKKETQ